MITVEQFLSLLENVTTSSSGWTAKCPAHNDNHPSLRIATGSDGRILVHCFSGCTAPQIVAAISLTMSDLGPSIAGVATCENSITQHGISGTCILPPEDVVVSASSVPQDLDPDLLHVAYSAVISALSLSHTHRARLLERGFLDAEIDERQYRTLPPSSERWHLFEALASSLPVENWSGVPGLRPVFSDPIAGPPGILLPCRDRQGRIVALKIRRDEAAEGQSKYLYLSSTELGGPGVYSTIHVPYGTPLQADEVRVTEGEFKAEIASLRTSLPTISFAGTSSCAQVIPVLTAMGISRVHVAFDMDIYTNKAVAHALLNFLYALVNEGFEVVLETWCSSIKGLDDLLVTGQVPQCISEMDALALATELVGNTTNGFEGGISGSSGWKAPEPILPPPPDAFPTLCLPPEVRQFALELSDSAQTPIDLAAVGILAVCASAVARKVRIRVYGNWREPLNIYTVTSLPSGSRKSEVFKEVVKPLREYESRLLQDVGPSLAEAMAKRRQKEKRLKYLEDQIAKSKPPKQTSLDEASEIARALEKERPPVWPRIIVDDVTPEQLTTILKEQNGRIAIMSPESSSLEVMAGRYAKGSPNVDVYVLVQR